jgi:DNA-binding CsgD family transcriptional regulator/PAS domain-containing protein
MARADEAAIRALIGRVYDAAADGACWTAYLEALRDATGASSAHVVAVDPNRQRAKVVDILGAPADLIRDYEVHFWRVGAWRAAAHDQPLGKAWASHRLIADSEFEEREFHRDFLRKLDLFYFCGGQAVREGAFQIVSGAMRARRLGPFEDEHVRLLDALLPHLQRAIRLDRSLRRVEAQRGALDSALERASCAVVLLDSAHRVVAANRAAEALLAAGDGLTCGADGLHAARPSAEAAFRRLLSNAIEPGLASFADGLMALPRNSGKRPLALFAAPMPLRDDAWWTGAAAAILFVSDPEASPESAARALARLYGLTRMEARVAGLLADGRGLREAAEALGVSRHTAQAHLKAIYAKTGLHNQIQLARLVGSLAMLGSQET